ncbi:MAG: phosphoribosylamine--glycine ligase [Myxococcales bacterium]|nr:phosphoribosylamine--glycine ligase [Myxococcales bacterium]MCB9752801.1 phosphoribosylamine--glycine ligase [Myxococcales bacterium]
MRILIIGNGGREHALAWRCRHEGHEVHVAPGNDGIAEDAVIHDVATSDHDGVVQLARRLNVDLVIVGPEQPLVEGVVDRLIHAGLRVFGPTAAAAELEGSKAAAKAFMARHGVPTARYQTVAHLADGLAALRSFAEPPVVKASGLAAGKGVTVPESLAEAEAAVRECLGDGRFGAAGSTVVLEQRLRGQEVSLFVLTDGTHAVTLLPAQDHKRVGEGDTGPNTGGMGAYCPAPVYDAATRGRVMESIVEPTLAGLRAEGRPFVGVLFVGLMIDETGAPFVIEYNCRFGDPEVQPLLYGLRAPIVPVMMAASAGALEASASLPGRPAATVVLASEGYPLKTRVGLPITGLDHHAPDVQLFHAGTRRDADGRWLTSGGRVLGVCARAETLRGALSRAYERCASIEFEGRQLRRDIGVRALS